MNFTKHEKTDVTKIIQQYPKRNNLLNKPIYYKVKVSLISFFIVEPTEVPLDGPDIE